MCDLQQHYKNVVNEVEKLNKRCKPQYRLTVLYIIDAIVRYSIRYAPSSAPAYQPEGEEACLGLILRVSMQNTRKHGAKDVYADRFALNLERSLDYILQVSERDQVPLLELSECNIGCHCF